MAPPIPCLLRCRRGDRASCLHRAWGTAHILLGLRRGRWGAARGEDYDDDHVAYSRRLSRPELRVVRRHYKAVLLTCLLGLVVAAASLSLPATERAAGPATERAAELASATSGRTGPAPHLLLPLSGLRLPDLDQEAPRGLEIKARGRSRYALGFRSAVRNVGVGPLIVVGSRPDRRTDKMHANQLVKGVDGARTRVPNVGWIRYVDSPSHSHWHYLEFDRYELQSYELRRFGGGAAVRDRKTGFCLGDRYRVRGLKLVNRPAEPVYTGNCGLSKPGLLHVREGISVGYGDDYSAFLEGQSLPLDGLPDGRYLLIHRVNEAGGLQELSKANNAASVLLALHWRERGPVIRVLARCPKSAFCSPRPPG
jgi:hypothetical protein